MKSISNINSYNLPSEYGKIIIATSIEYILSKVDDVHQTITLAYTNKSFEIENEIAFKNYKKQSNKFVINPNNIGAIGYWECNKSLIFYNWEGLEKNSLDINCYSACYDNNNHLYTVEDIDDKHSLISVYDENLVLLSKQKIEHPIFISGISLDLIYQKELDQIFIEITTGGQFGTFYCTINLEDKSIQIKEFINDLIVIEANSEKSHFLSIDEDNESLSFFEYPSLQLISEFYYSDDFEDKDLMYTLIYLKESLFLIFFNGIPYVYDALQNCIKNELKIENHLPKEINFFYPKLSDDEQMTDIITAEKFGSIIGFSTLYNRGFYVNISDICDRI